MGGMAHVARGMTEADEQPSAIDGTSAAHAVIGLSNEHRSSTAAAPSSVVVA